MVERPAKKFFYIDALNPAAIDLDLPGVLQRQHSKNGISL